MGGTGQSTGEAPQSNRAGRGAGRGRLTEGAGVVLGAGIVIEDRRDDALVVRGKLYSGVYVLEGLEDRAHALGVIHNAPLAPRIQEDLPLALGGVLSQPHRRGQGRYHRWPCWPGLRGSRCGGQGGLLGLGEEEHLVPFLHWWEGALQVVSWFPQVRPHSGPVDLDDLRAMPQGAQAGRVHPGLRTALAWQGPRALGWEGRQGTSSKALAGDQWASGVTRGTAVVASMEVVVLLLSALLAAVLGEGAGRGRWSCPGRWPCSRGQVIWCPRSRGQAGRQCPVPPLMSGKAS